MRFFKNTDKKAMKETSKLPMTGKVRKGYRAYCAAIMAMTIVQVGLSLKSHDPSQRANGFLTLAGGVIITFAKEILTLIAG